MARKIYSQLSGTTDGDFVWPEIADNTITDSIINLGEFGGRDWFSFDTDNVTIDDSQDDKYGVTIYDAGDADTVAAKDSLTYVNQQVAHRKNTVTSLHDAFDLYEAIINSDTAITDKFAAVRTAIDAELTELGF